MTLSEFDRRLRKVNPRLHIRKKGRGDVGGVFLGSRYLIRVTMGEFNVNGYSISLYNAVGDPLGKRIMKRGRKTVVKMLEKEGLIKNLEDRASLLWGIDP